MLANGRSVRAGLFVAALLPVLELLALLGPESRRRQRAFLSAKRRR